MAISQMVLPKKREKKLSELMTPAANEIEFFLKSNRSDFNDRINCRYCLGAIQLVDCVDIMPCILTIEEQQLNEMQQNEWWEKRIQMNVETVAPFDVSIGNSFT